MAVVVSWVKSRESTKVEAPLIDGNNGNGVFLVIVYQSIQIVVVVMATMVVAASWKLQHNQRKLNQW